MCPLLVKFLSWFLLLRLKRVTHFSMDGSQPLSTSALAVNSFHTAPFLFNRVELWISWPTYSRD
jgi:hypothetical protein